MSTSTIATTLSPGSGTVIIPDFAWPDWLVFSGVLSLSVMIGIYFGCFGKKNQTNEEYLLGGRTMNPVPVALSLLCSYVSSITLLGTPVEIYLYGFQLAMVLIAYIPLTLSLAFVYVPIYFQLQYTSIYEYLEHRYSRFLRIVCSIINIIYGIFFMSLVVYAPSLALELVVDIKYQYMVAIIFTVCIFYSSIGGFKAVLWTDSLQAVIMVVSMGVVVIIGTSKLGGFSEVWRMADETKRLDVFNFDVDPRTRHTFWTAVVGGYFQWLPMYANQAQIQRYISLPNYRSVYIALLINLFGLFFLMGMTYFAGLVIFGTYFTCDPIISGRIKSADQILPLFVVQTLEEYPGLPGLFVAGITCAGLSTVSSGVNALAASVVEDYVKKWKPLWNDTQLAWVSKGIAVATGCLSFGFVFIAAEMGNIFTAATSLFGIFGGPTFGVFICGMFFPWTNNKGVSLALLVSVTFMSFLGIGQTVYNNRGDLPFQFKDVNWSECPVPGSNSTFFPANDWKALKWDTLQKLFTISPLWYPAYGIISSVSLGIIFSFFFHKPSKVKPMDSILFIPIILKLWKKVCPGKLIGFVKFTTEELLENPGLGVGSTNSKGFEGNYNYPRKLTSGADGPYIVSNNNAEKEQKSPEKEA